MNKQDAFESWAPRDSIWTPWAKPVLFAHMPTGIAPAPPPDPVRLQNIPAPAERTAIVLDLPGAAAVPIALGLAEAGYRPVPLYNACPAAPGAEEMVEVRPTVAALAGAAERLAALMITPHAPPVFLLDARRSVGSLPPLPLRFDNRSVSLPTDFPSATFLASQRIARVLLIQDESGQPRSDLAHTLRRWEEAGIAITSRGVNDIGPARVIKVFRPHWYRVAYQRFLAVLGLRRNPLGGFGGVLPEPSNG
jgi:hypothetical protein